MTPFQMSWRTVLPAFILPFSMFESPGFLSRIALTVILQDLSLCFSTYILALAQTSLLGMVLCSIYFRSKLSSMTSPSLLDISSNTYINALPSAAHLARRLHHLDIFLAQTGLLHRRAPPREGVLADPGTQSGLAEQLGKSILHIQQITDRFPLCQRSWS